MVYRKEISGTLIEKAVRKNSNKLKFIYIVFIINRYFSDGAWGIIFDK